MITIKDDQSGLDIVIKFESVMIPEPGIGFPDYEITPKIFVKGEEVFSGEKHIVGGCSHSRRAGDSKLVRECFNYIIENLIK